MRSSERSKRWTRTGLWVAFAAGIAGVILSAILYADDPVRFAQSYLLAYAFWLQLPLGCLAIALLHELVGGRWGELLRPFVAAGIATLPIIAVFFLPVWLQMDVLFPWHESSTSSVSTHISEEKQQYLNSTAFTWRSVGYLLTWCFGGAFFLRAAFNRRHLSQLPGRRQRIAAIGVLLFVSTVSFAAVDWLMSLEPHWYSSIYGAVMVLSSVLAAWCFVTLLTGVFWSEVAAAHETAMQALHDVGTLLMAFLLLWTYFVLSQFLIIWSGDLPEETAWYFDRLSGGWQWFVPVIVAGHFVLPFTLLLSRDVKRAPRILAAVAGGLLLMRFVETYWSVMPAFSPQRFRAHRLDFAAPLAVGGLWLAAFLFTASRRLRQPEPGA